MLRKNHLSLSLFLLTGFFFTTLIGSAAATESRFTALEDGTVQDSTTGLIWAARDNGAPIIWSAAVTYCNEYSAGGHTDWRTPTSEELATLYGNSPKVKGQDYKNAIDVITPSIAISSSWVWTKRSVPKNKAVAYGFNYGTIRRLSKGSGNTRRALPVRSAP